MVNRNIYIYIYMYIGQSRGFAPLTVAFFKNIENLRNTYNNL